MSNDTRFPIFFYEELITTKEKKEYNIITNQNILRYHHNPFSDKLSSNSAIIPSEKAPLLAISWLQLNLFERFVTSPSLQNKEYQHINPRREEIRRVGE